jgi:hypothetical protein
MGLAKVGAAKFKANKPNKPKSELPGLCGAINRGDTQNTLKKGPKDLSERRTRRLNPETFLKCS